MQSPAFVTGILIIANVASFLFTLVLSDGGMLTARFFQTYGGNWGPSTFGGEWYRLMTSMFLHSGTTHLVANMWTLWILGRMAERCWTRQDYLLLYFGSGIAGSIMAVGSNPMAVTVGASGAIFGLAGALIAGLFFRSLPLKGSGARQLVTLILFTAYNIVAGSNVKTISNAAHLGGVLCGFCLGAFLTIRNPVQAIVHPVPFWRRPVPVILTVVLLAGSMVARQRGGFAIDLHQAIVAIQQHDFATSDTRIEGVLRQHPDLVIGYIIQARSYEERKDYVRAIASAQKAVDLDPSDPSTIDGLGILQFKATQYQDAIASFSRAVQICEQCVEAHYNLGLAYFMNEDYDHAIQEFETTVSLHGKGGAATDMLDRARRAKQQGRVQ